MGGRVPVRPFTPSNDNASSSEPGRVRFSTFQRRLLGIGGVSAGQGMAAEPQSAWCL
jgi:hypothetical protein